MTKKDKPANRPRESFSISKKAINALLNVNVSAEHVLVYLVLAKFAYSESTETTQLFSIVTIRYRNRKINPSNRIMTRKKLAEKYGKDAFKKYSFVKTVGKVPIFGTRLINVTNASSKAIEKYTGIHRSRAKEIIKELFVIRTSCGERLLYPTTEWNNYARKQGYQVDVYKPNKYMSLPLIGNNGQYEEMARYVLNNFNEYKSQQVSLPNELVTGISGKSRKGALKKPLKALKSIRVLRDEAVRLLLASYVYRGPVLVDGLFSHANVFAYEYKLEKVADIYDATLWKTMGCSFKIGPVLLSKITNRLDVSDEILGQLTNLGFFYCDVEVRRPENIFWYVLNTKTLGSAVRKSHKSIATYIENAIRKRGYRVAQNYGNTYRFNGSYPVLGRKDQSLSVAGILYPRICIGNVNVENNKGLFYGEGLNVEQLLSEPCDTGNRLRTAFNSR